MLRKNYDRMNSAAEKKSLAVSVKGLGANTN
jgi:hypothetical protein